MMIHLDMNVKCVSIFESIVIHKTLILLKCSMGVTGGIRCGNDNGTPSSKRSSTFDTLILVHLLWTYFEQSIKWKIVFDYLIILYYYIIFIVNNALLYQCIFVASTISSAVCKYNIYLLKSGFSFLIVDVRN